MELDFKKTDPCESCIDSAVGIQTPDDPVASAEASEKVTAANSRTSLEHISKAAIAIIIVCSILIVALLFILFRPKQPAGEDMIPTATADPADYSLAGSIRYVWTQSGNGLYMRDEPSSDGAIVAGIPDENAVEIRKMLNSWAYVSWKSYEGWCSMDYLLTEEEHTQIMSEFLSIPATVTTESSPLRLRESPSLNAKAVESMPKDSQVVILRLEGDWAYVDYRGISGWCSAEYLDYQE